MKQILFIFTLVGLVCCTHDKEATDDIILTLPFGKYSNWTNWEMKQMNFRIKKTELQIDTTYDLKPNDFRNHHSERLEDYPAISRFLKKPVTELEDLGNAVNKISCNNQHQFWIQYDNGTKLNLIKFRGTKDCNPTPEGTLSLVYQEIKMLQEKYKP